MPVNIPVNGVALSTLNELYSARSMRRRYEVWFLRLGLTDGSGAWWFRYLLTNLGRAGCPGNAAGLPVQVWATWFPRDGTPRSFIQGFDIANLSTSPRHQAPFSLSVGENAIGEDFCRGHLCVDGHDVSWDLRYQSRFHVTLSNKGWIGFSRTPHSDAVFRGEISLDGVTSRGDPLGWGLQGHNCGFRHRNFWTWTHALFAGSNGDLSTFEALCYEMPLGLVFRKAIFWHESRAYVFRKLQEEKRDRDFLSWNFRAQNRDGAVLELAVDGSGRGVHRLPYLKTDCSGTFEVANNSLANANLRFTQPGRRAVELTTQGGAVLEMVGQP